MEAWAPLSSDSSSIGVPRLHGIHSSDSESSSSRRTGLWSRWSSHWSNNLGMSGRFTDRLSTRVGSLKEYPFKAGGTRFFRNDKQPRGGEPHYGDPEENAGNHFANEFRDGRMLQYWRECVYTSVESSSLSIYHRPFGSIPWKWESGPHFMYRPTANMDPESGYRFPPGWRPQQRKRKRSFLKLLLIALCVLCVLSATASICYFVYYIVSRDGFPSENIKYDGSPTYTTASLDEGSRQMSLSLRVLNRAYTQNLQKIGSNEYQAFIRDITLEISYMYKSGALADVFHTSEVHTLRAGSVFVDSYIYFAEPVSLVLFRKTTIDYLKGSNGVLSPSKKFEIDITKVAVDKISISTMTIESMPSGPITSETDPSDPSSITMTPVVKTTTASGTTEVQTIESSFFTSPLQTTTSFSPKIAQTTGIETTTESTTSPVTSPLQTTTSFRPQTTETTSKETTIESTASLSTTSQRTTVSAAPKTATIVETITEATTSLSKPSPWITTTFAPKATTQHVDTTDLLETSSMVTLTTLFPVTSHQDINSPAMTKESSNPSIKVTTSTSWIRTSLGEESHMTPDGHHTTDDLSTSMREDFSSTEKTLSTSLTISTSAAQVQTSHEKEAATGVISATDMSTQDKVTTAEFNLHLTTNEIEMASEAKQFSTNALVAPMTTTGASSSKETKITTTNISYNTEGVSSSAGTSPAHDTSSSVKWVFTIATSAPEKENTATHLLFTRDATVSKPTTFEVITPKSTMSISDLLLTSTVPTIFDETRGSTKSGSNKFISTSSTFKKGKSTISESFTSELKISTGAGTYSDFNADTTTLRDHEEDTSFRSSTTENEASVTRKTQSTSSITLSTKVSSTDRLGETATSAAIIHRETSTPETSTGETSTSNFPSTIEDIESPSNRPPTSDNYISSAVYNAQGITLVKNIPTHNYTSQSGSSLPTSEKLKTTDTDDIVTTTEYQDSRSEVPLINISTVSLSSRTVSNDQSGLTNSNLRSTTVAKSTVRPSTDSSMSHLDYSTVYKESTSSQRSGVRSVSEGTSTKIVLPPSTMNSGLTTFIEEKKMSSTLPSTSTLGRTPSSVFPRKQTTMRRKEDSTIVQHTTTDSFLSSPQSEFTFSNDSQIPESSTLDLAHKTTIATRSEYIGQTSTSDDITSTTSTEIQTRENGSSEHPISTGIITSHLIAEEFSTEMSMKFTTGKDMQPSSDSQKQLSRTEDTSSLEYTKTTMTMENGHTGAKTSQHLDSHFSTEPMTSEENIETSTNSYSLTSVHDLGSMAQTDYNVYQEITATTELHLHSRTDQRLETSVDPRQSETKTYSTMLENSTSNVHSGNKGTITKQSDEASTKSLDRETTDGQDLEKILTSNKVTSNTNMITLPTAIKTLDTSAAVTEVTSTLTLETITSLTEKDHSSLVTKPLFGHESQTATLNVSGTLPTFVETTVFMTGKSTYQSEMQDQQTINPQTTQMDNDSLWIGSTQHKNISEIHPITIITDASNSKASSHVTNIHTSTSTSDGIKWSPTEISSLTKKYPPTTKNIDSTILLSANDVTRHWNFSELTSLSSTSVTEANNQLTQENAMSISWTERSDRTDSYGSTLIEKEMTTKKVPLFATAEASTGACIGCATKVETPQFGVSSLHPGQAATSESISFIYTGDLSTGSTSPTSSEKSKSENTGTASRPLVTVTGRSRPHSVTSFVNHLLHHSSWSVNTPTGTPNNQEFVTSFDMAARHRTTNNIALTSVKRDTSHSYTSLLAEARSTMTPGQGVEQSISNIMGETSTPLQHTNISSSNYIPYISNGASAKARHITIDNVKLTTGGNTARAMVNTNQGKKYTYTSALETHSNNQVEPWLTTSVKLDNDGTSLGSEYYTGKGVTAQPRTPLVVTHIMSTLFKLDQSTNVQDKKAKTQPPSNTLTVVIGGPSTAITPWGSRDRSQVPDSSFQDVSNGNSPYYGKLYSAASVFFTTSDSSVPYESTKPTKHSGSHAPYSSRPIHVASPVSFRTSEQEIELPKNTSTFHLLETESSNDDTTLNRDKSSNSTP